MEVFCENGLQLLVVNSLGKTAHTFAHTLFSRNKFVKSIYNQFDFWQIREGDDVVYWFTYLTEDSYYKGPIEIVVNEMNFQWAFPPMDQIETRNKSHEMIYRSSLSQMFFKIGAL